MQTGKKDSKVSLKATPSILSTDLKVEGDIVSSGVLEVEGFVKGNIRSNSIIVRESGIIEGDVLAENLTIKGLFNGKIKAININITSKAKITGLIEYSSLCVEDGASIDGQFKKISGSSTVSEEKSSNKA